MPGHKFDPDRAGRLDGLIRSFILPAGKVLRDIQPSKYEVWADIGAGTGYFAIPLSAMVDRVYAVDISDKMLDLLRKRLTGNLVGNVDLLRSDENCIPLNDASVDGVLLAFVAHELDKPAQYLQDVTRILKPNGRLVIVEFAKVLSFGPPLNHRLDPENVDSWATDASLEKGRTWQWSRSVVAWEYTKNPKMSMQA